MAQSLLPSVLSFLLCEMREQSVPTHHRAIVRWEQITDVKVLGAVKSAVQMVMSTSPTPCLYHLAEALNHPNITQCKWE